MCYEIRRAEACVILSIPVPFFTKLKIVKYTTNVVLNFCSWRVASSFFNIVTGRRGGSGVAREDGDGDSWGTPQRQGTLRRG
jgi:hypothetical protein